MLQPCLWFDDQAEDAARLYTAIFPNSRILSTTTYPEAATELSGKPAGSVQSVEFELDGQRFLGLNGGPLFKFSEAISFIIECKDQQEVDHYWERLTDGGEASNCGWLKDRFGVSWQVVPVRLNQMLREGTPAQVEAVTAAFLQMRKLEVAPLEEAYARAGSA